MKPSSFRVAIAAAWIVLLSAFTTPRECISNASQAGAHYYYYLEPSDSYDAYNSVADEILRLEYMTGHYVDTSPFGGTLIASGYTNNDYPHSIWASSRLYVHY